MQISISCLGSTMVETDFEAGAGLEPGVELGARRLIAGFLRLT